MDIYINNLWGGELFSKWRHNQLDTGNAHDASSGFDPIKPCQTFYVLWHVVEYLVLWKY